MGYINKENDISINRIIIGIKKGDVEKRNDLIKRYKPYIKKLVLDITHMPFSDIEKKDEFSIALIAFNEAIDKFDLKKRVNFFTFVAIVVRSKLINYIKSNIKYNQIYSCRLDDISEEQIVEMAPVRNFYLDDQVNSKMEIDSFIKKLKKFNITFDDLVNAVPKHQDSKMLCIEIAKKIVLRSDIFFKIENNNVFPKKEIVLLSGVNKKTIERNRKFIIAVSLIIGNGFENLRNFVLGEPKK